MDRLDDLSRSEIYEIIDEERDYQDRRWNSTSTGGVHSVAEYIQFMDVYIQEAKRDLAFNGEPEASTIALDKLRKIVAMGVACMEQNGLVRRD